MPNPNGNPNIAKAGEATRFKEGNTEGRKSHRNDLTKKFVKMLDEDFQEHGLEVIKALRTENPKEYAQIVARMVPAQFADEDGEPTNPPSRIVLIAGKIDSPD